MTNKWLVKFCKKVNKKVKRLNKKFEKHLAKLQKFSKEEWIQKVFAK